MRSVCFVRIAAEYSILRSGDVMVAESLTVRFEGDWNGVERVLVERAARATRGHRAIDIDVLGGTDARGNELRTETERDGDEVTIRVWVPGAIDATHTVVLRYRIRDGVTFFDDHDELYWNVWGSDATAPVAVMSVRVIPPEGTANLRAEALAGIEGSSERGAETRVDGPVVTATTTAPLVPGRGFTIVVGWDPGIVERPGALERFIGWLQRYWSFGLPVLSLALMWSLWRRRGRDPDMLPIVTSYDPPRDISPGEVGTMLDERADMRDVTATLVDLAVQGRLRIEEIEGKKVLGMEFGADYCFHETSPGVEARPTKPHEQKLLSALFGGRSRVELSDLKNEFYKDLPGIREAMMDCLVAQGIYTKRPDRVRAGWVVAGVGLGIVLFFLIGFLPASAPLAIIAVPILVALPVIVFGWLMPARTLKGARLIEGLRGFREFLSRVDGDRLRRMNIEPSAFERVLPFAMALGVEKKWGEAFEGLAQQPPDWYRSRRGSTFHPAIFVNELGRMSTASASTMSSQPRSSGGGGSGFGGGGSVGGGGGGGGGGGF